MYHLTSISRTMSSGFESTFKKSFATIEEAATYIHDVWYDEYCQNFEFPSDPQCYGNYGCAITGVAKSIWCCENSWN